MLAGAAAAGLCGWPPTSTLLPLGDSKFRLWPGPPAAVLEEVTERRRPRADPVLTQEFRGSSPSPVPGKRLYPPFPPWEPFQGLTLDRDHMGPVVTGLS